MHIVGFAERNQNGCFYSGIFYKLFNYLFFGLSRPLLSVFFIFIVSRAEEKYMDVITVAVKANECSLFAEKHFLCQKSCSFARKTIESSFDNCWLVASSYSWSVVGSSAIYFPKNIYKKALLR